MTRLELDPVNNLATVLKQVEDDLRELKNKQQHSGESGLIGYSVQTDDTWDSTDNVNTGNPAVGQSVSLEILFTGSGKQPFPIEEIYTNIYFNGTTEDHAPTEQTNGLWSWTDGTNQATMISRRPIEDESYSDSEFEYRWTVTFVVFGNITWYFKAFVSGSSDGTIEVNRLS